MKTITNNTGSKAVKISQNTGTFRAVHYQIYNGEQDVIQYKEFASMATAEKWANKVLA